MNGKPLWQADDITRAVRGQGLHEQSWAVRGVSIDSRAVVPGDLFVALQGPFHDGHDFVAAAFKAGAAAALVSRQPMQVPPTAPLIFVEDTLAALQDLGRQGRARARGKIIAVTGSVGKTSTKEMLRLSLGAVGSVYAASGSFNNHQGLLLALANLPPDSDYALVELDAFRAGELAVLSSLARPDIAILTTVEAVHLESFASLDAIADAQAEIFKGMDEKGVVILNRDSPQYARLTAAAKAQGIKKIMVFSEKEKADAVLREYSVAGERCAVQATLAGCPALYSIGAPGRHLARNSLAALLASYAASGKVEECAAALSLYKSPKGCGAFRTIDLSGGGQFTLIHGGCNANPASLCAAISVLADTKTVRGGRRILVLGDMRNLGPTAPDLHISLASDIVTAKMGPVFCCGDMMRYLYDALPEAFRGAYALDSEELAPLVARALRCDDIVSVIGSNDMKIGDIINALDNSGSFLQQAVNM